MLMKFLATSALATVLATGAYAQTATDPVIEDEGATTTETAEDPAMTDPATETAEDPAMPDPATETAEDPAMPDPATETAEDPAMPDPATETAEDPAMTDPAMTAEDPAVAPGATATGYPPLEEGWELVEASTVSADDLIGTSVESVDGSNIATIDDVVLSADGQVEGLAARFGGFLGFGTNTVELSLDEVQFLRDPNGTLYVRSDLTPEMLEGRPEYTPPAEAE